MNTTEKMIERIEREIKAAKANYEIKKEFDQIFYVRICAMIEMLNIETGKEYYFDEEGLKERK